MCWGSYCLVAEIYAQKDHFNKALNVKIQIKHRVKKKGGFPSNWIFKVELQWSNGKKKKKRKRRGREFQAEEWHTEASCSETTYRTWENQQFRNNEAQEWGPGAHRELCVKTSEVRCYPRASSSLTSKFQSKFFKKVKLIKMINFAFC